MFWTISWLSMCQYFLGIQSTAAELAQVVERKSYSPPYSDTDGEPSEGWVKLLVESFVVRAPAEQACGVPVESFDL